jgi:hypothetical protein
MRHAVLRGFAVSAVVTCLAAPSPAHGAPPPPGGRTVYSSIPPRLPGHVRSLGFQANAVSEFGDEVGLARTGERRILRNMRVVMDSWACQSGHWFSGDCLTAAGAVYRHPITANIYAVNNSGAATTPGALLASTTHVFNIPYRPSAANLRCTGVNAGRWFSPADNTCYDGRALTIDFGFPYGTTLPDRVIWTVAFNTTQYGRHPLGTNAPCFSSPGGCGYDFLNAGAQTFPGSPYAGTDIDPNGAFLSSVTGFAYCDGGAGGTGFLRLDTGCWAGSIPLAQITAIDPRKPRRSRGPRTRSATAVEGQDNQTDLRLTNKARHRRVSSTR